MLIHKLLKHILLLLFVTGGLVLSLHLLIVHHFLDHPPRLTIEIGQLAVLRYYLTDVNFGCGGDDVRPPVGARRFGEVDNDFFGGVRKCGESPG